MDSKILNSRNILIAVDESENASRAVAYVGDLIAGLPGFHINLLAIIPEPSEDYFFSEDEKADWIKDKNVLARGILDGHRKTLIKAGFAEEHVDSQAIMMECMSIAECILHQMNKLSCGTVVIGRRGISHKEEFIYGSTSNKILHDARDCAVWVIE